MTPTPPDPVVLSHLYLSAVLPCFSDLAEQDPSAREIFGSTHASICLRVWGGAAATLRLRPNHIDWQEGITGWPSVTLLFLGNGHLNAFFSGKRWAVPLPVWGAWRIALLARFSRLAAKLEATLNGHPKVLASAEGRRLHTRLTLIAAGLGLRSLAQGDEPARNTLRSLPPGLASFAINGEPKATVWFDHGANSNGAGWSDPPRRPDVRVVFADIHVAYAAMRDEIDTMAAIGTGGIKVDGLIPLADGLNFVMERMRIYLQP